MQLDHRKIHLDHFLCAQFPTATERGIVGGQRGGKKDERWVAGQGPFVFSVNLVLVSRVVYGSNFFSFYES